jgi:hypothetical protein
LLIPKELAAIWLEFDKSVKQFIDEKGEMYIELDRHLYELKQSPLKFHLKAVLLSAGYVAHSQDECLYYKETSDVRISIISVHVDDILKILEEFNKTCEQNDESRTDQFHF